MHDTDQPIAHLPERGWTAQRKALFLDRLAAHGNVRFASLLCALWCSWNHATIPQLGAITGRDQSSAG